MKKITLAFVILCLFFISCSDDSNCIRCTNERATPSEVEICDDSPIMFQDTLMNDITFEQFLTYFLSLDFVCEGG